MVVKGCCFRCERHSTQGDVSTNQEIPYNIHEKRRMLRRTEIKMVAARFARFCSGEFAQGQRQRTPSTHSEFLDQLPKHSSRPQQLIFVVQTTAYAALDNRQLSSGHQRRRYATFLCAGAFRTLPSRQHYHHQQQQQEQREGTSDFMLYAEQPSNLHHPE
jgi:hypothetical protein